jgi:hypothetical protein
VVIFGELATHANNALQSKSRERRIPENLQGLILVRSFTAFIVNHLGAYSPGIADTIRDWVNFLSPTNPLA